MRLRRRYDQEPGQPCAHAAAGDPENFRRRRIRAGCYFVPGDGFKCRLTAEPLLWAPGCFKSQSKALQTDARPQAAASASTRSSPEYGFVTSRMPGKDALISSASE